MKNFRIRPYTLICVAVGSGLSVSNANAQDSSDHRFYVSPLGSYTFNDSSRDTKDGYGGSIAVGKRITNGLDLEILGQYTSFEGKGGDKNTRLYGAGGGANIYLSPNSETFGGFYLRLAVLRGQGKAVPGLIRDYTTTLFDAGLGYNLTLTKTAFGPFAPGIGLRFEALYQHDAHGRRELGNPGSSGNQYFQDAVINLGLRIPLGGRPGAAPPAPEEPVQVVPVEEAPAPAPEPEAPPPCQPPAPGQPISLDGCKAGDTLVLRGVNFEFDKATLTVNAKALLDPVADALLARPEIKVELDGHTDSKGSDAYNQKLSNARAASVMQYLVGRGVDAGRMSSKGFGESMPVSDNGTDEGRELNRRVELKITDIGTPAPAAETAAPAEAAPAEGEGAVAPAPDATAPVEETPPASDTTTPTDSGAATDSAAPAGDASAPADATPPADTSAAPADVPAGDASAPADATTPTDTAPADAAPPSDPATPPQ